MATHEVALEIAHAIPIGNPDIHIPVKVDGSPFGRLKISRGGVDWQPSPKSKTAHKLSWEELADLMIKHGKAR